MVGKNDADNVKVTIFDKLIIIWYTTYLDVIGLFFNKT